MSMHKPFPELSKSSESELIESLLQWSLSNGLTMYPPDFSQFKVNHAPITLFPTPFPSNLFKNAENVQTTFNELYVNLISKQKSWLIDILRNLSQFDVGFTGKLFEIYNKSLELNNGKIRQPLSLGLFRSDYMINESDQTIKQIEFNTISVSFGGLSSKIGQLHNYLNDSGKYDDDYSFRYYKDGEVPISDSANKLAKGLADGNYYYNNQRESTKTVILFIVQPGERNCFDQRHIEYALLLNHSLKSYRMSLEQVKEKTTVKDDKLYIKATMDEISVVYYRSGYAPSDYEENPELNWDNRLYLENSLAIKCPSILTQLSGAKKVQQILTNRKVVKDFLPEVSEDSLSELLSTFADIYPLDDSDEGKKAQKLAFENSENYVLKPQREGGGNNIYKEDIPGFLKKLPKEEWQGYILMEIINPPYHRNKIIRDGQIYQEDIISELGIFGTVVFNEDSGEIYDNSQSGFLLRSKFSNSDEGGVAAGFGCVDTVYLYWPTIYTVV